MKDKFGGKPSGTEKSPMKKSGPTGAKATVNDDNDGDVESPETTTKAGTSKKGGAQKRKLSEPVGEEEAVKKEKEDSVRTLVPYLRVDHR